MIQARLYKRSEAKLQSADPPTIEMGHTERLGCMHAHGSRSFQDNSLSLSLSLHIYIYTYNIHIYTHTHVSVRPPVRLSVSVHVYDCAACRSCWLAFLLRLASDLLPWHFLALRSVCSFGTFRQVPMLAQASMNRYAKASFCVSTFFRSDFRQTASMARSN